MTTRMARHDQLKCELHVRRMGSAPHRHEGSLHARFVIRKIVVDSLLDWMHEQKKIGPPTSVCTMRPAVLMERCSWLRRSWLRAADVRFERQSRVAAPCCRLSAGRVLRTADGQRHWKPARAPAATRSQVDATAVWAYPPALEHRACRATGLARCRTGNASWLYAQLGYPEAARQQKLRRCWLLRPGLRPKLNGAWMSAQRCLKRGVCSRRDAAAGRSGGDHLDRGINCVLSGRPLNILGFQGMFPLFSSREDVVPDQRIADLIEIVEGLFGVYSQALGRGCRVVSDR